MIIKKELVVSGRKRAEILKDLKAKGFRAFAKETKKANEEESGEVPAEDEEDVAVDSPDNGYDYLLTVYIHLPFD
jgi:DNA topoisomerase II